MSRIKIWNESELDIKKPMPQLRLLLRGEKLLICAVTPSGDFIANITEINGNRYTFAKEAISTAGYDTEWAKWDKDGRFATLT